MKKNPYLCTAFEETILYKATARAADAKMGTTSVEQDCRCATFTANLTESIELVAEFEDETTGLREIVAESNAAKVMVDGVLYIRHNDEIYNLQGVRVE